MKSTLSSKTAPHLPATPNGSAVADREDAHEVKDTQKHNFYPKRICFRACSHLPCSIQGYRISSLDVIERWSLCYHLGCVVTCLAKVGLEQSNQSPLENWKLEDLKKAEWYLARELSLSQKCHLTSIGEQPFTTEAVLEDWHLSSPESFHLSEAVYHIKASKSPSMREESLREALKHLSAEIAAEIETLKGSISGTTRKQAPCFEVSKPLPTSLANSGGSDQACAHGREQTTNEQRGENE
jgi:hypothetical protein